MKLNCVFDLRASVALGRFLASKVFVLLAIIAMSLAVIAVYWSPALPDSVLIGLDYIELHE